MLTHGLRESGMDPTDLRNGDTCQVTGGTHKGKAGTVEDRKLSKTGQVTITVRLADGDRVKTLARNVAVITRP